MKVPTPCVYEQFIGGEIRGCKEIVYDEGYTRLWENFVKGILVVVGKFCKRDIGGCGEIVYKESGGCGEIVYDQKQIKTETTKKKNKKKGGGVGGRDRKLWSNYM